MRTIVLCACLALVACGCSKKVEVDTNGCYHGEVGGKAIDDCGSRSYTLKGDPKCATFFVKGPIAGSGIPDSMVTLRARIKGSDWTTTVGVGDSVTICQ